jgi:NTP pyrophosphatase (non-canonical NTP hydrolase)
MIAAKHMQSSEKNRMKLIKSTGSTWMAEGMTDAWLQKAGGLKNMNKQGSDIEIARAIEDVKRTIMSLQNIENKGYACSEVIMQIEVEKIKLKALEKYQNYNQYEIFKSILQERQRQDEKWGEQNHPLGLWTGILGEEYGELCEAINETVFDNGINKGGYENMRKEAIHVAAVAVAFLEFLERDRKIHNWDLERR